MMIRSAVALLAGLLLTTHVVSAQQITVAWDPNPESNIAGYRVHYGTQPGIYTTIVDAGNRTDWTLSAITSGSVYYFAVLAYNTSGLQSLLSSEVVGVAPYPEFPPVPPPPDSTRSDFTGDGRMDLLWQHMTQGLVTLWQLDGTSLVQEATVASGIDPAWRIVGTADFTADGKPDLIWHHRGAGWFAAWEMDGARMARALLFTPNQMSDLNWNIVGTADFTGDGKPDLLWQHTDGWFAAWEMDGTTFVRALRFDPNRQTDPNWKIVAVTDLTGDGWPDLLWQHTDGWFAPWEMRGPIFVRALLFTPNRQPDPNWQIAAVGDLTGDGKPDLVWRHRLDGWIAAWEMNGTTFVRALAFTPNQVTDRDWRIVGPR